MRDVFVWAYERSCQQYVAVHQQLVPPDIFRLRYRLELSETLRTIIQKGLPASEETIAAVMPETVGKDDIPHFIKLVQSEFKTLHSDNVVRFGLRPLEFAVWQERNSIK